MECLFALAKLGGGFLFSKNFAKLLDLFAVRFIVNTEGRGFLCEGGWAGLFTLSRGSKKRAKSENFSKKDSFLFERFFLPFTFCLLRFRNASQCPFLSRFTQCKNRPNSRFHLSKGHLPGRLPAEIPWLLCVKRTLAIPLDTPKHGPGWHGLGGFPCRG